MARVMAVTGTVGIEQYEQDGQARFWPQMVNSVEASTVQLQLHLWKHLLLGVTPPKPPG